ncbi:MAG: class D beta-lactamase [Saprospiraceae bacterium]
MKHQNLLLFLITLLIGFSFYSCEDTSTNETEQEAISQQNQTIQIKENLVDGFQDIIDSNQVAGSILIYDAQKNEYFSNDFERATTGFLPASTFKVINSIIGLETGVVENENHLFKWDGKPRRMKVWEKDLILAEAYKVSCVPCYQEIARNIGTKRMNEYLKKFDYGNIEIADSMIDIFWLEGEFKVTQKQQIDFLKRFYNESLPISDKTYATMRNEVMVIDDNEDYKLSGKTGWAIRNGNNIGWFIGYVEKDDNIYYMATNITPLNQNNTNDFVRARLRIGLDAIQQLGIIQ